MKLAMLEAEAEAQTVSVSLLAQREAADTGQVTGEQLVE